MISKGYTYESNNNKSYEKKKKIDLHTIIVIKKTPFDRDDGFNRVYVTGGNTLPCPSPPTGNRCRDR